MSDIWSVVNRFSGKKQISQSFKFGCNGIDVDVNDYMTPEEINKPLTEYFIPDIPKDKTYIIYGILNGFGPVLRWCQENKNTFYYIDHAYFNRGHDLGNYKVTKNEVQPTVVRNWPDDRWNKLNLKLSPWKKGGKDIIVCPPSNHMINFWGLDNWLDNTIETLKKHTDKNIVVRRKPKIRKNIPFEPLTEALQKAHAVVSFNSNVATEAVLHGVPVFSHPLCSAASVGHTDLTKIEEPVYPEREKWFHHLAYSQFNLNEFMNGEAWKILQETDGRSILKLK